MSLKDDKQQNIQMKLDFSSALTGEAREAGREETEASGAASGSENPASTNRLMEEVCERENLKAALRQVRANQGSPGVDGMYLLNNSRRKLTRKVVARSPSAPDTNIFYYFCPISLDKSLRLP